MVNFTRWTARLMQLCLLWLLVRFTQFLLKLCGQIHGADSVSNAELHLQLGIRDMLKQTIKERLLLWVEVSQ